MQKQGQVVKLWFRSQLTADFSVLPVGISLLLLSIIFQTLNSRFLSGENLANLISQNVPLALIATGSVLMLLIGEIDLSVGVVSGLAASIIISLNVSNGWSPATSIAIGVAVAAVIGLSNGFFVTKFGLPSFVVTLAGLLTWQGVQFTVLRSSGTINIPDGFISSLMSTYLSPSLGYYCALIAILIYSLSIFNNFRKRKKAGLKLKSVRGSIIKILLLAFIALGLVRLLNSSRGVSGALVFLLIVVSVIDYITRRTRFGRNLFAIGGNLEAASRVGINVKRVKVAVFIMGAILAATGGIFASSRLLAVSTQSGGSDLLLNAIAAAVIGGTSLFGGRGSVWAAVLGTLVIGFISNGMDLMNFGSETKLIVTGLVLLAAVSVDSVLRSKYRKRG
jgi:D-xylose transport system permease protein